MSKTKFKAGDFVNPPKLIVVTNNMFQCPVCMTLWTKYGSGTGFVKKGAMTHVFSCFENSLRKIGLRLKPKYNMEKLAYELEAIDSTNPPTKP